MRSSCTRAFVSRYFPPPVGLADLYFCYLRAPMAINPARGVAAVALLFSRRVVGWSTNTATTAQFVTDALVMVIW